jgi:hypothetical protein
MAPTPHHHPLRHPDAAARRRAIAAHPAGRARAAGDDGHAVAVPTLPRTTRPRAAVDAEDGSMTTEYGLLIVVGATACSLVIKWASGGAVFELLGGVLDAAKGLVGL